MINALKSELRKLVTVRTFYVLTALALVSVMFICSYGVGYRATPAQLKDPAFVIGTILQVMVSIPLIFPSIMAILFITHEYRYNTIMYTLTASNSRINVLAAKFLTMTIYSLLLTAALTGLAGVFAVLGAMAHGYHLVDQSIPYASLAWRSLFYGWGSVLIALAIGVIVRSQVGAIVALFVIPTVENLSSLILKSNSVYLPFTSSNAILMAPTTGKLSYDHAALVFGGWLLLAWIIAAILFQRRDAN